MTSQGYLGVIPDPEVGHFLIPERRNNNSRILETDSRGPETELADLETELASHRTHGTLELKVTNPRKHRKTFMF